MALRDLLTERGDPASADELDRLRALVPELPGDLAEFLSTTGGGPVEPSDVAVATPWGGRHITLDRFWPATRQDPAGNSVERATQHLRSEWMLPRTVLAIAGDVESNVICMSCEPDSIGALYLWDDTRSFPASGPLEAIAQAAEYLTPIAASLDDLATMLTDEPTAAARAASMKPVEANGSTQVLGSGEGAHPRPWVDPAPVEPQTVGSEAVEVYLYRHSSGQPDVVLPKPLEAARSNSGQPIAESWDPPNVGWYRPDTNTVDLIDAGGLLLLRDRGRDAIGDLLEPHGEFLRAETETGPLWVFRCLDLVDALAPDVELVEGKRGFIDLTEYRFRAEAVAAARVFTLPQQPFKAATFFTRPIVDAVTASDARALDFSRVWIAD